MKMTTSLVNEFINQSHQEEVSYSSDPFKILSKRELEILPLIVKGYGNKDIAEKLFVSVKTVEAHKTHIMNKLNLKSKPELVEYALKRNYSSFKNILLINQILKDDKLIIFRIFCALKLAGIIRC